MTPTDYRIKKIKGRYVVTYKPAGARQGTVIGETLSQDAAETMVQAALKSPVGTVQREGCEIAVGDIIHLGRKVRVVAISAGEIRLKYDLWPLDGREEALIGGSHPYDYVAVYERAVP